MKTLSELLKECSNLWEYNPEYCTKTNYRLEGNSTGFEFCIVGNWKAWNDLGLKIRFGEFDTPENAVLAFLNYVKENNLHVNNMNNPDMNDVRIFKMKEEIFRMG